MKDWIKLTVKGRGYIEERYLNRKLIKYFSENGVNGAMVVLFDDDTLLVKESVEQILEMIEEKQEGAKIGVGGLGITSGTSSYPGICNCGHIKGSVPMCGRTDCNQKIDL